MIEGWATASGLEIEAEIGRVGEATRFRLRGEPPAELWLLPPAADKAAVAAEAEAWNALEPTPTRIRIRRVLAREGRVAVVLDTDVTTPVDSLPLIGEEATRRLVRPVAATLTEWLVAGEAHGGLLRGGLAVAIDNSLVVLPPCCTDWTGCTGTRDDVAVRAGRDLHDLARLIAKLAADAGLEPDGGVPSSRLASLSPALAASLRSLAARGEGAIEPEEAAGILIRSGFLPRPRGGERSARRSRHAIRNVALSLFGIALPAVVAIVLAREGFFTELAAVVSAAGGRDRSAPATDAAQPYDYPAIAPDGATRAPGTPAAPQPIVVDDSEASRKLAEEILADVKNRFGKKTTAPATTSDPALDAALVTRDEGIALLATVLRREVPFEQHNATLEQAIGKLEAARTELEKIAEQSPRSRRQVDALLEDLNGIIFGAYQAKRRN
jgi:hypothetical protein